MDIVNFQILALISVLTTITTECIKTMFKWMDKDYVSNIIAVIVAVILSGVICIAYPAIMQGALVDIQLVFNALIMAFFAVLTATLGYDKVIQALKQLKE